MVGAEVEFSFSDEWGSLTKTAVFIAGEEQRVVVEAGWRDNICTIPYECLAEPDLHLLVGVYGTSGDGRIVIPTVYADLGMIWVGASTDGETAAPATPALWEQLQAQINLKENAANKVTSLSGTSTDAQYPSAKAVYDALESLMGRSVLIEGTISADQEEVTISTENAWQKITDAWNDERHPLVMLRLDGEMVAYLSVVSSIDAPSGELGVALFSLPSCKMLNSTPPRSIWLFEDGTSIFMSSLDYQMSDVSDGAVENRSIKAYVDEQVGNINTLLAAI